MFALTAGVTVLDLTAANGAAYLGPPAEVDRLRSRESKQRLAVRAAGLVTFLWRLTPFDDFHYGDLHTL
jgi:hypothetical protein